jgi:hypothetical protein
VVGKLIDSLRTWETHPSDNTLSTTIITNPPSPSSPKPDKCNVWIINNGDFHYAIDKDSFIDYQSINATAAGMEVIGYGTIELDVWRSPEKRKKGKLILEYVLHIPNAPCNCFSIFFVPGKVFFMRSTDLDYKSASVVARARGHAYGMPRPMILRFLGLRMSNYTSLSSSSFFAYVVWHRIL